MTDKTETVTRPSAPEGIDGTAVEVDSLRVGKKRRHTQSASLELGSIAAGDPYRLGTAQTVPLEAPPAPQAGSSATPPPAPGRPVR